MNNVTAYRSIAVPGPAPQAEPDRLGYLRERERAARAAAERSPNETARQVHQDLAQLFYWMRKQQEAKSDD